MGNIEVGSRVRVLDATKISKRANVRWMGKAGTVVEHWGNEYILVEDNGSMMDYSFLVEELQAI